MMTPATFGESPSPRSSPEGGEIDDSYLMKSVIGGAPAALRALMSRYDRLVRYTIFQRARHRCRMDPEWLDSVASATWAGFVQSLNRSPETPPSSVSAYLVRIARNQVASRLRKQEQAHETLEARHIETVAADRDDTPDPLTTLSVAEDLAALQACIASVGGADSELLAHLEAITDRRWKDAAAALGLPESTLRSRWQRLLDRLRDCVEGKTGKSFAPGGPAGD